MKRHYFIIQPEERRREQGPFSDRGGVWPSATFDFLYKWGMLLTVVALVAVFGGVGQLPRPEQHHQHSALDCHRDGDCRWRVDFADRRRVRSLRGLHGVAGERAGHFAFVWHGFGTTESIVITLALCTLVGLFNAFLIVILRIPDMLATLASLFVIQGVAMTYSYGGSITENMVLPSGDMAEGTIQAAFSLLGQVPTIVIIMLAVTLLAQLGLSLTTHGRRMYAIGGNPEAARLSGIRTTRYKVAAYVIASLLAGLGGILLASRIGSSQVNAGGGYLMDAVAAAWIGFAGRVRQAERAWHAGGGGDPRRAVERAGDALRAVLRHGHNKRAGARGGTGDYLHTKR